jgi:hypothetical protein
MLRATADFIFPTITPLSSAQKASAVAALETDKDLIEKAEWSTDANAAMEQAVRLADAEVDRRKTAESKASTYLAVLAALVPVVLSIEAAGWEKKVGPAPEWLRLSILGIAIIYTAAAGWNAVRTLQVTGFHALSAREMAQAWSQPKPVPKIVSAILKHTRDSQNAVNQKVTFVKLTHMHLMRAFGCFIALLLLDPIAYGVRGVLPKLHSTGADAPKSAASNISVQNKGENVSNVAGLAVPNAVQQDTTGNVPLQNQQQPPKECLVRAC